MAPIKASEALNPVTKTFEWGGPIGAAFMVLSLPLTVIGLNTLCNADGCSLDRAWTLHTLAADSIVDALPQLPLALALELAWFGFHWLVYLSPLGRRVTGMPLRNGSALEYNMNAIHAYVISHVGAAVLHVLGVFDLALLAELFVPLMLAAILLSIVGSVALYAASFRAGTLLAVGGNSGNAIYDFWVGRELNPRVGALDLKFMCELRPGLIGWSLLNWAFVAHAHARGVLTPALVLVAFFESWYVADGLTIEDGNLTMMDIVHDGFGFMLCFGDHAWVPFVYTLKAKYLAFFPQYHSAGFLAACVALQVLGYVIFRGANSDKDRFRKDPKDPRVAHLKVMKTSTGRSLIISGYWGACRHPNYVGDWMMTVAESALCGCGAAVPLLFQPLYFGVLLMHRQLRDEHQMRRKYGEADWAKFCSIVKYRLIPGVY